MSGKQVEIWDVYKQGQADKLQEIIDYVKSDEFIDSWNRCPRGTRFGDFFAELLKERFDG